MVSISQLCDKGLEVKFNKTECYVTDQEGEVLLRGVRAKKNCYKWVPSHTDQTKMLIERLEHQKIRKNHDDSTNNGRRICFKVNHINHSTEDSIEKKVISTEDSMLGECTKILGKIEQLKDKLSISLQKKLWRLIYYRRAKISLGSLLSLVHPNLGSFFHFLIQLPTKNNHFTLNPSLPCFLSKTPKTVCLPSPITKHRHLSPISVLYHHHQYNMKFKTDVTPSKKTTSNQLPVNSSIPKRVEPLTTVTPILKKNAPKSVANKKKSSKKFESKDGQV